MRSIIDSFFGVSLRSGESAIKSVRDAKNVDIEKDLTSDKNRLKKAKGFTLSETCSIDATFTSQAQWVATETLEAGVAESYFTTYIDDIANERVYGLSSTSPNAKIWQKGYDETTWTLKKTMGGTITGLNCGIISPFDADKILVGVENTATLTDGTVYEINTTTWVSTDELFTSDDIHSVRCMATDGTVVKFGTGSPSGTYHGSIYTWDGTTMSLEFNNTGDVAPYGTAKDVDSLIYIEEFDYWVGSSSNDTTGGYASNAWMFSKHGSSSWARGFNVTEVYDLGIRVSSFLYDTDNSVLFFILDQNPAYSYDAILYGHIFTSGGIDVFSDIYAKIILTGQTAHDMVMVDDNIYISVDEYIERIVPEQIKFNGTEEIIYTSSDTIHALLYSEATELVPYNRFYACTEPNTITLENKCTVYTVASGHGYTIGDCIMIEVASDTYPDTATLLQGKLLEVLAVTATTVTVDISTNVNSINTYICKLHNQLRDLGTYIFDSLKMNLTSGDPITNLSNYGTYDITFDGYIYSFIGTDTYQLLCKAQETVGLWASVDDTLPFTSTNEAMFDTYEGFLLFVKGEKKTVSGATGGTFYVSAAGTILLFGEDNNPTGKYIVTAQERIWIGHITAIGSGDIADGKSWQAVSKIYPEAIDTAKTITSSTSGNITTITFGSAHSFHVGESVFVSGSDVKEINNQFVTILNTTSTTIDVDFETATIASTGTVTLRGTTWTSKFNLFDNGLAGGGIFKCDDNSLDYTIGLIQVLGAVIIFRQYSIYLFIGNLATGEFSLSKQVNTEYGAASSSVVPSNKGAWFVSKYGLSKIEGIAVQTQQVNFDNILSVTASYAIQSKLEAITDKSVLKIFAFKDKVWLHDNTTHTTYVYDTVANQWVYHYGKFAQQFIASGDTVYSVSNGLIYKHNDGFQVHSPYTMESANISSLYPLGIMDQETPDMLKFYKFLYFLFDGVDTTSSTVYVDVYFNGSKSEAALTIEIDNTVDLANTWAEVFVNTVWINNKITGSDTWEDLSSNFDVLLAKDHYYNLGKAKQIQLVIRHDDNCDFNMTRIDLEYDQMGIRDVEDTK